MNPESIASDVSMAKGGHDSTFLGYSCDLSQNLPDNSNMQCNLFISGLDESMTSEDLHTLCSRFGDILSAKVSVDPVSKKSKGYGFVWFRTEEACTEAINASANYQLSREMPYPCQIYQNNSIRLGKSIA